MKAGAPKFKTVEEYLSSFPANVKAVLERLRKKIKQAAPQAEELISYNMPAYKWKGMLVYYAAYKGHIGFYPMPSGIEAFRKELSAYEISKGTVRFPIHAPLPLGLIGSIVKFRAQENLEKTTEKTKKKKSA